MFEAHWNIVQLHGAELVEDEKDAQFIICDPKSKAFQRLTEKYLADKSTYVEPPAWITQTINSGRVKATAKQAVQLATSPRYIHLLISLGSIRL